MTYEETVKRLQDEAMANMQKRIADAKARQKRSAVLAQQSHFIMSMLKARYIHKLTQKQLAEKIGTTQSAIARIESGKGNPGLRTLLKIAQALDTNLSL